MDLLIISAGSSSGLVQREVGNCEEHRLYCNIFWQAKTDAQAMDIAWSSAGSPQPAVKVLLIGVFIYKFDRRFLKFCQQFHLHENAPKEGEAMVSGVLSWNSQKWTCVINIREASWSWPSCNQGGMGRREWGEGGGKISVAAPLHCFLLWTYLPKLLTNVCSRKDVYRGKSLINELRTEKRKQWS